MISLVTVARDVACDAEWNEAYSDGLPCDGMERCSDTGIMLRKWRAFIFWIANVSSFPGNRIRRKITSTSIPIIIRRRMGSCFTISPGWIAESMAWQAEGCNLSFSEVLEAHILYVTGWRNGGFGIFPSPLEESEERVNKTAWTFDNCSTLGGH